jgi:hypothetical protein
MSIREQTIGMSRDEILNLLISKLDKLNGKIENLKNEIQDLKEWTHY